MKLRIKELPDLSRGRDAHGSDFCLMCHKPIRNKIKARWVHVVGGGGVVLHPDDEPRYEPDGGDCGGHLIGPDCAKALGLEWSRA